MYWTRGAPRFDRVRDAAVSLLAAGKGILATKEETMRIASGLATAFALLIGSTRHGWAQTPGATDSAPAGGGSTVGTLLTLAVLAVIVIAIVVGARYVSARRKRIDEAMILQSQLSDMVAREPKLHGLVITPKARVSGWRGEQVTIEVAGDVPTPELRETVMKIVSAEAWRLKPDVITLDHLFIVPPVRRTSDSIASRG